MKITNFIVMGGILPSLVLSSVIRRQGSVNGVATCESDSDCDDGKLRGGTGKCIHQAAAGQAYTDFCAYTTCNAGYGTLSVQSSGRPGVKYTTCQLCDTEDTVSGGTRACTKVTKDNFREFTFECYRGDRINSDCNRGTISTNAYGLCVVPATPVDSTWAAGKDFARSSDNVGPGYCAYTVCKTDFTPVPNAFSIGQGGQKYTACTPS